MACLIFIAGCEKTPETPKPQILCNVGKVIGYSLANEMSQVLGCQNISAINDDFLATLVSLKVCEKPTEITTKGIGSSLCITAGRMLFDSVTAEKFSKWQCEGGLVKEKLLASLDKLCSKISY